MSRPLATSASDADPALALESAVQGGDRWTITSGAVSGQGMSSLTIVAHTAHVPVFVAWDVKFYHLGSSIPISTLHPAAIAPEDAPPIPLKASKTETA